MGEKARAQLFELGCSGDDTLNAKLTVEGNWLGRQRVEGSDKATLRIGLLEVNLRAITMR